MNGAKRCFCGQDACAALWWRRLIIPLYELWYKYIYDVGLFQQIRWPKREKLNINSRGEQCSTHPKEERRAALALATTAPPPLRAAGGQSFDVLDNNSRLKRSAPWKQQCWSYVYHFLSLICKRKWTYLKQVTPKLQVLAASVVKWRPSASASWHGVSHHTNSWARQKR